MSPPESTGQAGPVDPLEPDQDALEHALAVFAANCEGRLVLEDQALTFKYVVDPAGGRLVASVPAAVLLAGELVLFVPEETEDALQLLLSAEECAECAASDRWIAYHGEPEHVHWAACWVDSGKHGPWVFDGDAFTRPNPLAPVECALCRMLNEDKTALSAACRRLTGVDVPQPMCVGVDPRGAHVRARFGIVRLRFDRACEDEASARAAVERLLASA